MVYQKRYILYSLLLFILFAHFALTLLFVLPQNPIKNTFKLADYYIGRFFYQDWGLFAPDPIDMDISVLVRCIGENAEETPIWNITENFNRYNNRENRVQRVAFNYAHSYINASRNEVPLFELCSKNPNHLSCVQLKEAERDRKEGAKEGLRRVSSAFCADMRYVTKKDYTKAQIKIVLSKVPRWSKRYTEGPMERVLDIGVVELYKTRAFKIWKVKGR
ncbi:hypothetical protein CULT_2010004 [[Clostridium] ultunense Esp]|nr:hypothetical protein CULT_2010004 [[Clostridium] ultunense Esp]